MGIAPDIGRVPSGQAGRATHGVDKSSPPSGDHPSRIAARLSSGQREALALSCDGWELAFYFKPGMDHPGDRGSVIGQPYWMVKRGRFDETPKSPHWKTAVSLQELGLISWDGVATALGRQVCASADTHPKGEDAQQASAPLSSAVGATSAETPK